MPLPAGRRRLWWYLMPLVALMIVVAATVAVHEPARRAGSPPAGPPAPTGCAVSSPDAGLRALADRCGILVGAAVNDQLFHDPTYRDTVAREFNSVTPESAMKWGTVEARPGEFNFLSGEAFVGAAERDRQRVRGHTLVWHRLPAWVTDGGFDPARLRAILKRHVQRTVAEWRGRIDSWDVINEPLNGDGSLRRSVWQRGLGDGYIADALRWARQADPLARLYVNDFGVEGLNRKSDRLYRLVRDLRARGVPVDGVGFQTHVFDGDLPASFEANLRRFAALGVEIALTEVDAPLALPVTPDALRQQATVYARTLNACLAVDACRSYTTWGFTDLHSWGDHVAQGRGAALPFDRAYQPKPAYWALRDALVAARPRGDPPAAAAPGTPAPSSVDRRRAGAAGLGSGALRDSTGGRRRGSAASRRRARDPGAPGGRTRVDRADRRGAR
jgi:endo-1,4-beta-xylanase